MEKRSTAEMAKMRNRKQGPELYKGEEIWVDASFFDDKSVSSTI